MDADLGLSGQRVLVVQDEWIVARDTAHILEKVGAVVVGPAAAGPLALALIDGPRKIDVALLDINLHDGMALEITHLLDRRAIPYISLSGYPADGRPSAAACCEKPFDSKALVAALAGALRPANSP